MENVTRALILAFSMLIFATGFAYSMYLINKLTATSSTLLETISTKNYYDNIEVASTNDISVREVGIETIIPTLYRYYKENYAVKIIGEGGKILQIFDVNLEGDISSAIGYTGSKADNVKADSLKKSIYNKSTEKVYFFGAPWMGSTDEDTRARIDYFLNGTKGYINNVFVNYSNDGPAFNGKNGGFIKNYAGKTFYESFVEYAYTGETISTANGLETITGNTQESSKIIITYTLKE